MMSFDKIDLNILVWFSIFLTLSIITSVEKLEKNEGETKANMYTNIFTSLLLFLLLNGCSFIIHLIAK